MEYGNPDCACPNPEILQPVRNRDCDPKLGMSYTKLTLKRCGRSKSETARFAFVSKAFPCAVKPTFGRSGLPPPAVLPGSAEALSIDFENVYAALNCNPFESRFVKLSCAE